MKLIILIRFYCNNKRESEKKFYYRRAFHTEFSRVVVVKKIKYGL